METPSVPTIAQLNMEEDGRPRWLSPDKAFGHIESFLRILSSRFDATKDQKAKSIIIQADALVLQLWALEWAIDEYEQRGHRLQGTSGSATEHSTIRTCDTEPVTRRRNPK